MVVVLKEPVHVAGFKLGATRALGISAAGRRRGIDADVLLLSLAEPESAERQLTGLGVTPAPAGASCPG